jgi:hypothetical protein
MARRGVGVVAVAVATTLALLVETALAATIVVSPQNMAGWTISNFDAETALSTAATTTSGTFTNLVVGPATPPMGIGSLHEHVGTNGNDAARLTYGGLNAAPLGTLASQPLSYWTYVTTPGSGGQAPYLMLFIDRDGDGEQDDILFFEPVYQNGTYTMLYGQPPVPNQCGVNLGCVTVGQWQFWDAQAGGWWSLEDSEYGPPLTTLSAYLAQYPDARLVTTVDAVWIASGYGHPTWANFDGNADALTIGGNTWNFEPVVQDTQAPTCRILAIRRVANAPTQSGSDEMDIIIQDTGVGIASISTGHVTNGTVNVPDFIPGTTSPIVVTVVKTNQSSPTSFSLVVTDVAGNTRTCR